MFKNIKGIGPKKAEALKKLGVNHEKELLFLLPRTYEDKRHVYELAKAPTDRKVVFELRVLKKNRPYYVNGKSITKIEAEDTSKCSLVFFNDRYTPAKLDLDKTYYFYAKPSIYKGKFTLTNPEVLDYNKTSLGLKPIYPLTKGLGQKDMNKFIGQMLDSTNIVDFLDKTELKEIDINDTFKFIHWPKTYDEINMGYEDLLYRKILLNIVSFAYIRNNQGGHNKVCVNKDILGSFLKKIDFTLTSSQYCALGEILEDLANPDRPMNRLLQGDVGSGKTIVAILSSLAVLDSSQAAFIAPTEILASQHYLKYKNILTGLGYELALLTGSTKQRDKESIKRGLIQGKIDLIFGTHSLIQDTIRFKNLGLVITDEQHKFGVSQRNALIKKATSPNILVMSATPIPRTLAIASYGNLDISNILTKPEGRKKIDTFAVNLDYETRVFDFIDKEVRNGNQAYIVAPSISENQDFEIESVESIAKSFRAYNKSIPYEVLHGGLTSDEKNETIRKFSTGEIKVLISTTVVEVGVDVADATLMVIYNAERFGLSQLHQLRGRVGRSKKKSYCILICTSNTSNARKRMKIMTSIDDGFLIAEKDLEMRGPGQILGLVQAGNNTLDQELRANKDVLNRAYKDALEVIKEDPKLENAKYVGILKEIQEIISNISGYSLN